MKQFIGITGSGAIGKNPMGPDTWSGSSRRFFQECNRKELLRRTFGVELSNISRSFYGFRNFDRNRATWKRKLHMDVGYRNQLTKIIGKHFSSEDFDFDMMQIGTMYNVPEIVQGKAKCYSYNDGNFAMSLNSPYFPRGISRDKVEKVLKYEIRVTQNLDRVFTMSEYLRQSFIKDYSIREDRVICIGAGINLDEMPEIDNLKDYEKKEILFIGADFERKGGLTLLKAFKAVKERIPGAVLNIVGPRTSDQISHHPGVVWHGFLRKDRPQEAKVLDRLFREAVLFVMPSIYEPFGIAPLEAMSYQVPCIVSDAWALPEIVPKQKCGELVAPGDWEHLAESISQLLVEPERLKSYGLAGRMHVEANFTWEKVVERVSKYLI